MGCEIFWIERHEDGMRVDTKGKLLISYQIRPENVLMCSKKLVRGEYGIIRDKAHSAKQRAGSKNSETRNNKKREHAHAEIHPLDADICAGLQLRLRPRKCDHNYHRLKTHNMNQPNITRYQQPFAA